MEVTMVILKRNCAVATVMFTFLVRKRTQMLPYLVAEQLMLLCIEIYRMVTLIFYTTQFIIILPLPSCGAQDY